MRIVSLILSFLTRPISTIQANTSQMHRYNNAATSKGMCHRDILLKLYYPGMKEAARILKPGGQLWVKCKDEIESSEQRWSHREMYNLTRSLGYFQAKDYAILHAQPPNGKRWDTAIPSAQKSLSLVDFRAHERCGTDATHAAGRHGGDRTSQKAKEKASKITIS